MPTLAYLTHYYDAIVAVGEEAPFDVHSKFGNRYIHLNRDLAMVSLTSEIIHAVLILQAHTSFNLTITDGNGAKVTSSQLYAKVVQEIAKKRRNQQLYFEPTQLDKSRIFLSLIGEGKTESPPISLISMLE